MKHINCIWSSPNGQYTASSDNEGKIDLWESATGRSHTFYIPPKIYSHPYDYKVIFSPDSKLLMAWNRNDSYIWNTESKQLHSSTANHFSQPRCFFFSQDNKVLVIDSSPNTNTPVWLRELGNPKNIETFGEGKSARLVVLSSNAKYVAVEAHSKVIHTGLVSVTTEIWDLQSIKLLWTFQRTPLEGTLTEGEGWLSALSNDGKLLASVYYSTLHLYRINTHGYQPLFSINHNNNISRTAFNDDGTLLASVAKNVIYIWNTRNGQLMKTLEFYSDYIQGFFWNDKAGLIAGNISEGIKCWHIREVQQTVECKLLWTALDGNKAEAAIQIQTMFRGFIARKESQHLKDERKAFIKEKLPEVLAKLGREEKYQELKILSQALIDNRSYEVIQIIRTVLKSELDSMFSDISRLKI